jgi:hypothetical protein
MVSFLQVMYLRPPPRFIEAQFRAPNIRRSLSSFLKHHTIAAILSPEQESFILANLFST